MNKNNNKKISTVNIPKFRRIAVFSLLLLSSIYLLSCQVMKPKFPVTSSAKAVSFDPYNNILNMVVPANKTYTGAPFRILLRNTSGTSLVIDKIVIVGPDEKLFSIEPLADLQCKAGAVLNNRELCYVSIGLNNAPAGEYRGTSAFITLKRGDNNELLESEFELRAFALENNDKFKLLDLNDNLVVQEDFGKITVGDNSKNLKVYKVKNETGTSRQLVFSSTNTEAFKLYEITAEVSDNTSTEPYVGKQACRITSHTLDDGEECYIGVRFFPYVEEEQTSIITVTTSSMEDSSVSLFRGRGNIEKPIEVQNGPITIDQSYIQYANPVYIGTKSGENHSIRVTNTSTEDLSVKVSNIETSAFTLSGSCFSQVIIKGGDCNIALTFRPLERKRYSDFITITYVQNGKQFSPSIPVFAEGITTSTSRDIKVYVATGVQGIPPTDSQFIPMEKADFPLTLKDLEVSKIADSSMFVKVTNSTADKLFFKDILAGQSFRNYDVCGGSIMPNTSCMIEIKVSPDIAGRNNGVYSISSDKEAFSIPLLAVAKPSTSTGDLIFSKEEVNFPDTPVDDFSVQSIFVTNTTQTDKVVSYGRPSSNANLFTVTSTCGSKLPAKNSCQFNIVFRPIKASKYKADITIDGEDIELHGRGIALKTADTDTPITDLKVEGKRKYFGQYSVGSTSPAFKVKLVSPTATPLRIEKPGADFELSTEFTTCIVDQGNILSFKSSTTDCILAYAYKPRSAGMMRDVVKLTNLASTKSVDIDLIGEATSVNKGAIIGYIYEGGLKIDNAIYANTTARPIKIMSVAIKGNRVDNKPPYTLHSDGVFEIGSDGCRGQTIMPNESCKIAIMFKPRERSKLYVGYVTLNVQDATGVNKDEQLLLAGSSATNMLIPIPAGVSPHTASHGQAMATYNGLIYSMGGTLADKANNRNLYTYNPNTNKWNILAPTGLVSSPTIGYNKTNTITEQETSPRYMKIDPYDGYLYFVGGVLASSGSHSSTEIYYGKINIISLLETKAANGASWAPILPSASVYAKTTPANDRAERAWSGITRIGSKFFFTGGRSTYKNTPNTPMNRYLDNIATISYDMEKSTDTFEEVSNFQNSYQASTVDNIGGVIYSIGGKYVLLNPDPYDEDHANFAVNSIQAMKYGCVAPNGVRNPVYTLASGGAGEAILSGSLFNVTSGHSSAVGYKVDSSGRPQDKQIMIVGGNLGKTIYTFQPTVTSNPCNNKINAVLNRVADATGSGELPANISTVTSYDNYFWIHSGDMMFLFIP